MIGKTISHYKILEKLGEGGMGVVYKAEDTKLKRIVALKFLPPDLTRDEEAKARFIQEAQAASSLQHRNICTIHEIDETEEGQVFICMDFYKGESLKEKIGHRPLRIEDAIDIASQIAQGLASAHKAGIFHRDIKPANIQITEQNEVKIIDFGLAKLTGGTKFTRTGTTVGTAAYMSPEQLRAEKVDHRTDIWALGVVMYQMLTGLLPFKGEYEQAISYSILNEDPEPITSLRTGVSLELERIIMKAVAKEPGHRYQHAEEMPVDLETIESGPGAVSRISAQTKVAPTTSQLIEWKKVIWLLLAGLFLGAILTTVILKLVSPKSTTAPAADIVRFEATPSSHELGGGTPSISADGKHIAYTGFDGEKWLLYLRNMNQFEGKPIAENGSSPFFSPDGHWLGYIYQRKLYKVAVEGGTSIPLVEFLWFWRGGFWSSDDSITFATPTDIYKVSADGSNLHVIAKRHSGKIRFPSPLPGGKAILCTIWHGELELAQIGLLDLETDSLRVLFENGTAPCYAYSGHIVYANEDGVLMAAPLDVKSLKVTGTSVPTSEIININEATGHACYSLSQNGSLVYVAPNSLLRNVVTVDRQGNENPLIPKPGLYNHPHYSPDGKKLVVLIREKGTFDIWIYDIERGSLSRLPSEKNHINPRWTPDGNKIVFSTVIGADYDICQISADGTAQLDSIYIAKGYQKFNSISNDRQWLFFTTRTQNTKGDIWVLPFGKESKAQPLIQTLFDEDFAEISPDGRWLAYHSNETRQWEVYVRSFPDPSQFKIKISTDGGWSPVWSPDGKELFYRWGRGLYSVHIETEPEFMVAEPKVLFEREYDYWETGRQYDIHSDGNKFVMIKPGEREPNRMFVVLNWLRS